MADPFLLQPITDYVQRAIDRMLSTFDSADTSPNIIGMISAFADQMQDLENCSYELLTERMLNPDPALGLTPAEGVQLDVYGKLVGLDRGGLSDDDYRALIIVQLSVNNATGTIDDLITVVSAFLSISPIEYLPVYPAALVLQWVSATPLTAQQIADLTTLLPRVIPAGVGYAVVEGANANPFRCDTSGAGCDEGLLATAIIQS